MTASPQPAPLDLYGPGTTLQLATLFRSRRLRIASVALFLTRIFVAAVGITGFSLDRMLTHLLPKPLMQIVFYSISSASLLAQLGLAVVLFIAALHLQKIPAARTAD